MYVGNHGCRHVRLNKESKASQILEIDASVQFLKKVGARTKNWIICYPYGVYNNDTLNILKSKNYLIGLTTKLSLAELSRSNMLELNRFDTNDLSQ
jgi:peptidoglycan/xylan/chitin deacetylase (PgdA/CDA1 family)